MANSRKAIATFINWLSSGYISLERKAIPYPCKFIDDHVLSSGKIILEIQYSGLASTVNLELDKVIDKNIFEYFSPQDKKKIFQINFEKTQLRLSESYKCSETGKTMIVLTEIKSGNQMVRDVNLIISDERILAKIDPISAARIGGIANDSKNIDINQLISELDINKIL